MYAFALTSDMDVNVDSETDLFCQPVSFASIFFEKKGVIVKCIFFPTVAKLLLLWFSPV